MENSKNYRVCHEIIVQKFFIKKLCLNLLMLIASRSITKPFSSFYMNTISSGYMSDINDVTQDTLLSHTHQIGQTITRDDGKILELSSNHYLFVMLTLK